jgi:hypothetical protein
MKKSLSDRIESGIAGIEKKIETAVAAVEARVDGEPDKMVPRAAYDEALNAIIAGDDRLEELRDLLQEALGHIPDWAADDLKGRIVAALGSGGGDE